MRGQGEAALRMVRGTQSMEAPCRFGQETIFKFISFTPPAIPDLSQIIVRRRLFASRFSGQETTDAEQSGLQGQWRFRFVIPTRARFCQTLHRPNIVFVTERAKKSFPERLFPTDVTRSR